VEKYLFALFLAPPALTIAYSMLEYAGKLDDWTGRRSALSGLERLISASGSPISWIYDDEQDRAVFHALEKRISKRTTEAKVRRALAEGHRPGCITVGGLPMALAGVPDDWPAARKRVYTPSHPVLYLFDVDRSGGKGKGERVCSLGELERWLAEEKDRRAYYLGAVALGIISLTFIAIRLLTTG
jgi:hypothetical protein